MPTNRPDGLDWLGLRAVCVVSARRTGADRVLAEDAAQNAMMRLWKHRDRLRPGVDASPLAAVIARREAQRLLGDARLKVSETPETAAEAFYSPEFADETIDLRRALQNLSERERHLLALRYVFDLSQPQIAATLDIPEGTTKIRLHRARAKLRAILEEDGI